MAIQGEVKEKLYSVIADSIDVLRLFQSAVVQIDRLAEENATLKDRCDTLERSFGDTAALEHTISELRERNDRLRLRNDVLARKNTELEHRLSTEPPPQADPPDTEEGWKIRARLAGQNALLEQNLARREAELEKYKAALASLWYAADEVCIDSTRTAMRVLAVERMKEEGYDIETEEHAIEGFGSSGCDDNSDGADEHDFL